MRELGEKEMLATLSRRWNSSDAPFQLTQKLWSGGTKGWKTRPVRCLAGVFAVFFCTCNGMLRTV